MTATFTKDCLRFCVRVGTDRPETFNIASLGNPDANIASLAAYALEQIEEREKAETTCKELLQVQSERDRLAKELEEAEEAINAASGMSFLREMGWTEHPAVRRAIDRAGGKG